MSVLVVFLTESSMRRNFACHDSWTMAKAQVGTLRRGGGKGGWFGKGAVCG
jgi:hypothetical protein